MSVWSDGHQKRSDTSWRDAVIPGDQSLVSHARDVRLVGGDCEEHKFDRWGNLVEWDHWLELR